MPGLSLAGNIQKQLRRSPHRPQTLKTLTIGDVSETPFTSASFSSAVFNLSTTVIGAGIMALPAAVKVLGLVPGIFTILMAALLTRSSIDMILRIGRPPSPSSSSAKLTSSYAGVAGQFFGHSGRILLQICIVVNNLGMLVVYMVIIGDVLSGTAVPTEDGVHHTGVMDEWLGRRWWTTRPQLLLLTTVFVFVPLVSFKRVDSLSYTSAAAVALAVVFVGITVVMVIVKITAGSISPPRLFPQLTDQSSLWKLFTAVPIITTSYICHYNIHPIEKELKDPTEMAAIVNVSLGLCSAVYVATSAFGFLLFGESTMDDVLANFDSDLGFSTHGALLNDAVRVSYALHLILVFPIVFFSLRLNVVGLLFPRASTHVSGRRFFYVTAGLMGAVYVGATLVPSIWVVFQFTGATAAVAVGFVFPAAIALKDVHGVGTWKDKVLACVMLFVAVSSSTIAILTDGYDLFWRSTELA